MSNLQLFHNSQNKDGLLKSKQFRKPVFNYVLYMDHLIEVIHKDTNNNIYIPNIYNEQKIQPPYMGVGIYCFDNYQFALEYDSVGQVVEVQYKPPYDYLDLDNPEDQLMILSVLDSGEEKIKELFKQKDEQQSALLLLELVKNAFMTNFENKEPIIGVMLFILYEHIKMKKHDIVSKSVYSMLNSRYETYYILQNYSRKKVVINDIV